MISSVLILAVAVGVNGPAVAGAAAGAVCKVLTLGGGSCGGGQGDAKPRTDEDYKPAQCKIREDSEKAGSKVTVGWFSIGDEFGFVRQEFSDGTVRLTIVDTASLGATGSGKEKLFDIGKLGDDVKGGRNIEVAAGLKFGYGTTWQFKDADEAQKFRGEVEKYALQQEQMKYSGEGAVGIAIYNSITDNWADPPDPTITFAKTSVEASAKGALGLKIPTGPAPEPGKDPPTADPNIGASLTLKGEYEVLIENNQKTGNTSWTYQLSGQATGQVNAAVAGAELSGKTQGAMRVTRNAKGELVSLSFISTREGSGQVNVGGKSPVAVGGVKGNGKDGDKVSQATVTVTTLDLTNPQDRAVAQDWLSGNNEQFGSPLNLTVNTLVPTKPPAAGDAFGKLMYEQGKASQTVYDNVTDLQEFGVEVNLGFKLGFSVSLENTNSVASASSYLGAPVAGGTRPLVDFAECH